MKISTRNGFARDTRGNVPMMTAISMIIMIAGVGAAVDYSTANNAQKRTQDIADSIALKAAAFVREHDRAPTGADQNGLAAGTYTAKQLGYGDMLSATDVKFTLVYDMQSGEARVTSSGKAPTSFSKAMGFDETKVTSQSTATFVEKQVRDVASIALVLDNSGSMAWDAEKAVYRNRRWQSPSGAKKRIEVLKKSVKGLMADLRELVGDGTDQRIVRTGYAAFSGRNIFPRRSMAWQTMTDQEINTLRTSGGTYPDGAMRQADSWMSREDRIHQAESGKTPLKYVIYLSDGENTQVNQQWVDKNGTGKWRRETERRTYVRDCRRCGWRFSWETSWYDYANRDSNPDNRTRRWTEYGNYRGRRRNRWASRRYDYTARPYTEGDWSRPTDDAVIAACNSLKAKDVKIYAIGFGLEPGKYMSGGRNYYEISEESSGYAYAVLNNCASDDDSFIIAKDSADLEEAFNTIGEDIMEEVIRVKS